MKRSQRWNTLQICRRRDSNSRGSNMWSNTLPLDHGGVPASWWRGVGEDPGGGVSIPIAGMFSRPPLDSAANDAARRQTGAAYRRTDWINVLYRSIEGINPISSICIIGNILPTRITRLVYDKVYTNVLKQWLSYHSWMLAVFRTWTQHRYKQQSRHCPRKRCNILQKNNDLMPDKKSFINIYLPFWRLVKPDLTLKLHKPTFLLEKTLPRRHVNKHM